MRQMESSGAPTGAGWRTRAGWKWALAAVGLFGLLFAVLRVALPVPVEEPYLVRVSLAQDVLLAGLFTALLWRAGRFVLELRDLLPLPADPREREALLLVRDRAGSFALLFVLFATPLLLWFLGEYPGHLFTDQLQSLYISSLHRVDPWLSSFWGLYAGAIDRASGDRFATLVVLNILLLSWVLADSFSLMLRYGLSRRVAVPFVVLLMSSIPVGLLSINLSHDILAGFLKLAVQAVLLRVFVRGALRGGQPGTSVGTLALLGVLVLCSAFLRGENLALYAYIPAVLLLTRQARWRAVAVWGVCIVAGNLLFRQAVEPAVLHPLQLQSDLKERYTLTLLLNPLSFMVTNDYYSATPEEDRRIISELVQWDCVVQRSTPYELPCYWGSVVAPVTKEKIAALRRVYVLAALNNPGLYLASRSSTFFATLGLTPAPIYPFLPGRESVPDATLYGQHTELVAARGLLFERDNPGVLSRLTHRLRDWSFPHRGVQSPGYFIWNGLPALLLLLGLLATVRSHPVSAAIAGVSGSTLVLFFLATPASHVTYLADLWVFGYLAVPLLVFERTGLRRLRLGGRKDMAPAVPKSEPPVAGPEGR